MKADWNSRLCCIDKTLVVLGMPSNFGEREGLIGSILSYFTREVPGETGSLVQKQIEARHSVAMNRTLVLIQETSRLLYQVAQFESRSCFFVFKLTCMVWLGHFGKNKIVIRSKRPCVSVMLKCVTFYNCTVRLVNAVK